MNKRIGAGIAAVLLSAAMAGCTGSQRDGTQRTDGFVESVEENSHGDFTYRKEFGTYTVLDGWMESETHSTEDKFFYVKEGHDEDAQPDNISINIDTNRYGKDDYFSFKDAIMAQIAEQIGDENVQLNGTGTYTANDDILIVFEITEDSGIVTKQYYIVGDYKYCLVQLTNYDGDEDATRAADIMADSFVWRD